MSNQLNLEEIKDVIVSKVCVLVIGPDLVKADEGTKGFYESFLEFLGGENIDVKDYYLDEGFFYFSDLATRNKIRRQLDKFCSKAQDFALENKDSIYRKIARMPFDLILSFSPDLILKNVFEELKIDHAFYHYSPGLSTAQWNIKSAIRQKPVLINLVGRCNSDQEIILTHEDFIRYFSGIYGHNKLPDELIGIFEDNENNPVSQFVILGYRYEKWHYKLLLDKLNFPGDNKNIIKTARCMNIAIYSDALLGAAEKKYYEKKFLTSFCSDYNMKDFIEDLYKTFDETELRQPAGEEEKTGLQESDLSEVEENLLNARLDLAIKKLRKLLAKTEGDTKDAISNIIHDYNAAQNRAIDNWGTGERISEAGSGMRPREPRPLIAGIAEEEARPLRKRIQLLVDKIRMELKMAANDE